MELVLDKVDLTVTLTVGTLLDNCLISTVEREAEISAAGGGRRLDCVCVCVC